MISNHSFFLNRLSMHSFMPISTPFPKKLLTLVGVLSVSLVLTACNKSIDPVVHEPTKLVSLAQNPSILQPIAHFKMGDGHAKDPLNLQAVMQGNQVFAASRDGKVQSYQLGNGSVWAVDLKSPITAGVTVDGHSQTLVVAHKDGNVTALNAQNGAIKWQSKLSGTVLAPALIAHGRVLVMANDGSLYGLNLQTGKTVWQFNTSTPAISVRGAAAPILLGNNLALFSAADGHIYALTVDSGLPQWSRRVGVAAGASAIERMSDVDAMPVIDNNELFVISYSGQLTGLDLSSKSMRWRQNVGSLKTLALTDNAVIVTDLTGKILAFNRQTGELLWQNEALMYRQLTNPVVINRSGQSLIAVGDFEGYVHLLDSLSGNIVSRIRGQGSLNHLTVTANRLMTQSMQGDVQFWQW